METLAWGWDNMPKSFIFEKMMELALPIVNRYRSDFFHDAMYLNNLPDEPTVFYYSINENGTHIFPDTNYQYRDATVYRITISRFNRNDWGFEAEKV